MIGHETPSLTGNDLYSRIQWW